MEFFKIWAKFFLCNCIATVTHTLTHTFSCSKDVVWTWLWYRELVRVVQCQHQPQQAASRTMDCTTGVDHGKEGMFRCEFNLVFEWKFGNKSCSLCSISFVRSTIRNRQAFQRNHFSPVMFIVSFLRFLSSQALILLFPIFLVVFILKIFQGKMEDICHLWIMFH